MSIFKSTFLFLVSTLLISGVLAQSPLMFNYQAVLRDASGEPLASEEVVVDLAIMQGSVEGEEVFSETHTVSTNEFGLINLQVGSEATLEGIDWSADDFFIQVSVDGTIMGSSQLLSVPFALHSATSGDAFSGDYEDLENTPVLDDFIWMEEPETGDMLFYDGESWTAIPIGEEGQVLTLQDGTPQWEEPPADDNGDDNGNGEDTVTDIDGNVYQTAVIGNQEWMMENLRTTKYKDGTDIPTGLNDSEWGDDLDGAYAVYPHDGVAGIDSEEEMAELYGNLYNWHAVTNDGGICPAGWQVPSYDDWNELVDYLIDNHSEIDEDNVGNALKSCRQVDSPLGGECDTEEHPRWDSHDTQYGTDEFGFSAVPGGNRAITGGFFNIGSNAHWWSSTEISSTSASARTIISSNSIVNATTVFMVSGYNVRCVKVSE